MTINFVILNGTPYILCAEMKDLIVLILNILHELAFGSAVFELFKFKLALKLNAFHGSLNEYNVNSMQLQT